MEDIVALDFFCLVTNEHHNKVFGSRSFCQDIIKNKMRAFVLFFVDIKIV